MSLFKAGFTLLAMLQHRLKFLDKLDFDTTGVQYNLVQITLKIYQEICFKWCEIV